MKQRFGIKDIAQALGISVSTVSRALRDAHDVNPETRQRVIALTEKLNFKRNNNAAALASGNTKNIGVVLPFITNYYFATVISGIQEEAYEHGYTIILYVTNDDVAREKKLLENMATTSLDGLLISISSHSNMIDHFKRLLDNDVPLVFFDRVPHDITASKVMQSDFDGAYMATRLLISRGFRRIAHLAGPAELAFTQERLRGYRMALSEAEIAVNEDYIVFSDFSQQDGQEDTEKLLALANPPNGIFAVNDRKAVGAIQTLKRAQLDVGNKVAVIGFTNDPIATIIEPNLTTIEEPAFEIGRQSCRLLIKHIKNHNFEAHEIVLPCALIERDSVCYYQAE